MHYRKNFLTNVILRFDFGSIPELMLSAPTSEFSKSVEGLYPHVIAKPTPSVSFTFGPSGPVVTSSAANTIWEHRTSADSPKVLCLSHDFLSLEYGVGAYDHFPPFLKEVSEAYEVLRSIHHPAAVNRIGLRYINDIRQDQGAALDWDGLIQKDAIAGVMAGFNKQTMKMHRSFHQFHATEADISLVINYGLFNPEYPAPLIRRSFLLDIDASTTTETEASKVLETLQRLNKVGESTFEGFIDDDLRNQLEILE